MQNEDAIIEQLIQENKLLRERVNYLGKIIMLLQQKEQLLEKENSLLKEKINQLEKNSSNSSKPSKIISKSQTSQVIFEGVQI